MEVDAKRVPKNEYRKLVDETMEPSQSDINLSNINDMTADNQLILDSSHDGEKGETLKIAKNKSLKILEENQLIFERVDRNQVQPSMDDQSRLDISGDMDADIPGPRKKKNALISKFQEGLNMQSEKLINVNDASTMAAIQQRPVSHSRNMSS